MNLFFFFKLLLSQCFTLFPYTTLFRSGNVRELSNLAERVAIVKTQFGGWEDRKSTRLNSVTWPSRMPSSACKKIIIFINNLRLIYEFMSIYNNYFIY